MRTEGEPILMRDFAPPLSVRNVNARFRGNGVLVRWEPSTAGDLVGYRVFRSTIATGAIPMSWPMIRCASALCALLMLPANHADGQAPSSPSLSVGMAFYTQGDLKGRHWNEPSKRTRLSSRRT